MTGEERFRSIYNKYTPLLRVIARKKGIPESEIEDFVQETFAAYYSHYSLDWEDRQVRAALVKILKNLCVDYYRKLDSRPLLYCDPMTMEVGTISSGVCFTRDNLSIILERQECNDVAEILRNMKEDWAQVIYLYIIEERPMEEVSQILGISRDACRARLSRGRKYLRGCLEAASENRSLPEGKKTSSLEESAADFPEPEGV